MKRTVPLFITACVGFVLIIAYFVPAVGNVTDLALIHFDILAAIAFILGGGNLLRTHGEKIYKQQSGWGYSLIALGCFLLMLTVGLGKIGVSPAFNQGSWTGLMQNGESVSLVQLNKIAATYELSVTIRRAEANSKLDLSVAGTRRASIDIDEKGRAVFKADFDADEPQKNADNSWLAEVAHGAAVTVGSMSGQLAPFGRVTGEFNANGSWFWWLYEYGFQPLQQTTFAMLAFYVASAAFRAFRAKNTESILLLGTAFVILLGRTYAGTYLTQWAADPLVPPAPDDLWGRFLSFFYMPNLTEWIMNVFNKAGNRAIMIGIALGVASTSLKVLLGIDRSYLGSDKG
ncbi:MAG: hypothetical protein IH986_06955 [Planctomycetes bacterium]|nr:hypothetical protein [Planctomycetota bacterium]